jgi:peptidoglycan/LPS O-acetylase OafA/YrhL
MNYRPEIDGLRAIAVLPVLFFHAGFELFGGGFVGVDIFFVISGYLITSIILKEKLANTFTIRNFYERRARRILPALFFIMFCSIPAAFVLMTPSELKDFGLSLSATSLFGSNILFWQDSGYFAGPNELKPLLHTWSLAVEEQYYLLFPIFLMLIWRIGLKWILGILIVLAVVSLLISHWAAFNAPVANFYLLPTRGWELLLGVFAAFYVLHNDYSFKFASSIVAEIAGIIGMLLIAFSIFVFDASTPFPSFWALIPTLGTVLIILFATPKTLVGKFLSIKFIVATGLISYSLYLWHQPIFAFSRMYSSDPLSSLSLIFLIVLSFLLAYVSWRYVEKIFRDKNRISRKNIFVSSILGSILFLAIGSIIYSHTSLFVNKEIYGRYLQLEHLKQERKDTIQSGICHFNGAGKYTSIDKFMEHWSCLDNDEEELSSLQLGIFGDSHSSDIAMSLRLNGYDFIQIGGANCELLNEELNQPLYCKAIHNKFKLATKERQIQNIILANNLAYSELTVQNLSRIFDRWSNEYKNIIFFSPMPESIDLHRDFLKFGKVTKNFSLEKNNIFYDVIESIDIPDNIIIVNSIDYLCAQTKENCFFVDHSLRVVDETHLSVSGAKFFGNAFSKTKSFSDIFN